MNYRVELLEMLFIQLVDEAVVAQIFLFTEKVREIISDALG